MVCFPLTIGYKTCQTVYTVVKLLIIMFICCCLVYEIRLGTVDQPEADTEWRLKPYMNTAKKRLALSNAPGFEQ